MTTTEPSLPASVPTGDELETLRFDRLQNQLRYCVSNSPHYAAKFAAIGAEPGDIRTWEDFRRLPPLLTKEEQRQSQLESVERFGHPYGLYHCAPLDEVVGIYTTSGTTGDPTFYLFTNADLDVHHEITRRIHTATGVRPGTTLMWTFGTGIWVAGSIPEGFHRMGVRLVNVGLEGGSEAVLKFLRLVRPETLVATPSMAGYLVERCPEVLGIDVRDLGVERLTMGGEPGAGIPETRQHLGASFGADVYDFIGPTSQFGYASCDAPEYAGMHDVAPDLHIWADDLVDPVTRKPLEITDGVIGEALMTDLTHEAGPVLKYSYGDMVQVFTSPCVCGRPGRRIRMLGRADDMLIVKGVNVYPAAIRAVVESFIPETTGVMRIVLSEAPPMVVPPLTLRIEVASQISSTAQRDLASRIQQEMHKRLRITPRCEFVEPKTFERKTTKTPFFNQYRGEA